MRQRKIITATILPSITPTRLSGCELSAVDEAEEASGTVEDSEMGTGIIVVCVVMCDVEDVLEFEDELELEERVEEL